MNRVITCSLLVAVVLGLASAYDYQDPDYNQILAREWEELMDDSVAHPRQRRSDEEATNDKCKRRKFKFCCADEVIEQLHEDDKPLKKECFKQVTGKDKPSFHTHDPFKCDKEKVEKHRREFNCVMTCVGQKKGIVDEKGHLIVEKLKSDIKERFAKETWLTPKIDAMLDKCTAEGLKELTKEEKEKLDKDSCSCQGMKFAHCFWKELQLACPADQIKDQKACEKVRERINIHQDYPFPPPHRHHDDE